MMISQEGVAQSKSDTYHVPTHVLFEFQIHSFKLLLEMLVCTILHLKALTISPKILQISAISILLLPWKFVNGALYERI